MYYLLFVVVLTFTGTSNVSAVFYLICLSLFNSLICPLSSLFDYFENVFLWKVPIIIIGNTVILNTLLSVVECVVCNFPQCVPGFW